MSNHVICVPFSRQQRITNVLLLNASFIDNLGLMHGKMGIAIYFFHLARETKNQIYEDYAGELIDEIYDEISISTPLDFEGGLAGIGWGIEYLVQHGFIEGDTDEILESIDNQLRSAQNQFQGVGLLNGLTGLGTYYLNRIQKPAAPDEKVTTLINKQMLVHLIDELELRVEKEGIMTLINGSDTFTVTWGYPVLIAFLTEVHQLNLSNFKVGRMLQKVIDPLFQQINLPKLQSKRLLLALAIEKTKKCKIELGQDCSIDEIIQNLLKGLDRETISNELPSNSAFMQNGTSGIAWIYKQLYKLTGKEYYQTEALFWSNHSFEFDETDQGYAGFNVAKKEEDKAFGILNGLAGIYLIQL